jgi:hypothetical protein
MVVAAAEVAPTWVSAPPAPSDKMLFAVGSAGLYGPEPEAQRLAGESARAELAKLIRVEVSGSSSVATRQSRDGGATQLSQQFDEAIVTRTPPVELNGLRIDATYMDRPNRTVYALASLDRAKAVADLGARIAQFDDQLVRPLPADQMPAVERLRQALEYKKIVLQRQRANQQLIALTSRGVKEPAGMQDGRLRADAILDSVSFAIVGEDAGGGLDDKLGAALTSQGLRVAPATATDLTLRYRIKWRDLERNGLFSSVASAAVRVMAGDRVLAVFEQQAKGASSDRDAARDKAIDNLGQHLNRQLSSELLNAL